jgi:hypothetical protein
VQLHEGSAVQRVEAGLIVTEDGAKHAFDEALWCTQAAAAGWLKATGLPTGAQTPRGAINFRMKPRARALQNLYITDHPHWPPHRCDHSKWLLYRPTHSCT